MMKVERMVGVDYLCGWREQKIVAAPLCRKEEGGEGRKERIKVRPGPLLFIKQCNGLDMRVRRFPSLDTRCTACREWLEPYSHGSWIG